MNRHLAMAASTLILILLLPAASSLAEDAESPIYKSWAKHKVGTSMTIHEVTTQMGTRYESDRKFTLIELYPDRVVLEMYISSQGKKVGLTKMEYRRAFPLMPGIKKEDIGKPPREATAKGEEKLKLAEREFDAVWYDTKGRVEIGETITRVWTSPDVPGTLLKSVFKVPVADKVTTLELVEIKEPADDAKSGAKPKAGAR